MGYPPSYLPLKSPALFLSISPVCVCVLFCVTDWIPLLTWEVFEVSYSVLNFCFSSPSTVLGTWSRLS